MSKNITKFDSNAFKFGHRAKLAAVADDVPDYGSAEELDGYTNGLLPAADLLAILEDRRDEWAEGTLAAIARGERSRKNRRGALDEWLSMALHNDGEAEQRKAILEADGGVEACLAAARLLTSTNEKSSAITGWAAVITCSATLGFALSRERARPKPRAKLIATLEARLEEIEPFGGAI